MNRGLVPEHFSAPWLIEQLQRRAEREGLWRNRVIAKGETIFGPETDCRDVFLLLSGLVKLSYLSVGGSETIKSFVFDQGIFAREYGGPEFGAYAIEGSHLVQLPQTWVLRQISESNELQRGYAQFIDWIRLRKAEREQSLLCLTPQERLVHFRETEPDLADRLPQGDIARYLGVTPIAYSRIKRRIDLQTAAMKLT
ncbi:MAG: hypothetical protein C0515_11165 [Novosphingobium sp.]|nr:hypothetical protein [Novosphingobium sp.]